MTYSNTINKEVMDYNNHTITKVGNPIVLLESKKTSSTKLMNINILGNLASSMYL